MSLRLKIMFQGAKLYWRIFKPLTMGVKLLLIRDDSVYLVNHSYQKGWFLPGGGIKKGESVVEAAKREAREEVGGKLGELELFGIYANMQGVQNDHVVVMLCQEFTVRGANDREILEARFFPYDALPPDVSAGTRHRVQELINGAERPLMGNW